MTFRNNDAPSVNARPVLWALALALTLATAACQEPPATDDIAARDARAGTASAVMSDTAQMATAGDTDHESAGTRAALPRLFGVMLGLQRDMDRISRGIWTESYDSIATAARAVADHPTIGADGISKVQGVLGEDMARFKTLDVAVHDLALEVAEHAAASDLEALLDAEARLRQGCVECHTAFRQRLRDAL